MPRQSVRSRLSLLISALLCVVVAALGWLAHRQLEGVLLGSATTRLSAVTRQLAGMLAQSTPPALEQARALAGHPAVALFLSAPGGAAAGDARRALDLARARLTDGTSYALWSPRGERLLAVGPLAAVMAPPAPPSRGRRGAWVGPLARTDSGMTYQVVAPVLGGRRDTLGLLVTYRRVVGEGVEQVRALIGADAVLMIGNAAGGGWTDLARPVAGPPAPLASDRLTEHTAPGGERVLGMATPIRFTPWVVWVQIPRRVALEPARDFLLAIAVVALVVVALGTLAAWLLSHHITAPLAEITGAARDLARGDYARRVAIARPDELGSLARSFNSMATQVEAASRELTAHALDLEAANAELRESELRYRQLFELSPDAIVVHRDGVVAFANPAALELVGALGADELVGRPLSDLLPPGDREELLRSDEDTPPGEGSASWRTPLAERHVRRLDGTTVPVEAASSSFVLDGEPSVLTILRDVSERRRLEERFRQAQKMEAVGQLAGGIAHDFNNLLTVITSYTGILLAELPARGQARDDVREIADAAHRAATLTRQLLAFGRQQMLQPQVVELNRIVADMERMLRRVIREDIHLVTELDPALGRVSADPGQLEQVLMNLAVNARDAMPDGGTLTVRTANVELDEREAALHAAAAPGPYVVLTVTDTGVGMTAEQRERIFEPFYTTKDPGRGTGLGLATVYGIVRQSGGHVWVYSEPGHGAVFKIYLPRVDAPADPRPGPGEGVTNARGSETILLAEDEGAVRAAARRILEGAGYRVIEAASGTEALARFGERGAPVELLLTDMVMPEMSGRDLAARLRELDPAVRVVFMSGYTEDAVLRRGGGDLGAGFVQKPFTPQSLTRALREALDR